MLELIKKYFSPKATLALLFILFSFLGNVDAQYDECGRDSWAWPGHNNWFMPKWAPNNGASYIINQKENRIDPIKQPNYNLNYDATETQIRGYQGNSCASNDQGEMIFFTNGRNVWNAKGDRISEGILQGNECNSTEDRGSAVHGTMILRHPLQPSSFYIVTIDDIVQQGATSVNSQKGKCGNGITFAVVKSDGTMVHDSEPIERDISSGTKLGAFRTTEGFSATFHGNGVDIWITFQPLWQEYYVSYLLTCEGFVTAPVISGECSEATLSGGNGDLDFSPDGSLLAVGAHINQGDQKYDPYLGLAALNLYDFDNWTGKITNRKMIWKAPGSTEIFTNVIFNKEGSELHYSGFHSAGKVIPFGTEEVIRASHTTTSKLVNGFSSAQLDQNGEIVQRTALNTKYSELGGHGEYGVNDMYIPPLEEPDMTQIGPFCDTSAAEDIHTYWRCAGVSSEDSVTFKHSYYLLDSNDATGATHDLNSNTIVGEKTGIFDPAAAGVGVHRIVFEYCDVNDTIEIVVKFCPACKAELKDDPESICAGNEIMLDSLILDVTATGTENILWSVDSVPTNSGNTQGAIKINGPDTMFDATSLLTNWGVYKVMLRGEYNGDYCYDSVYITVDSLPIPVLKDSTICEDWLAVELAPGTYDSYLWGPNGETDPTITVTDADTYTVTVTDGNGCEGDTSMVLTVNELPKAILPGDTFICVGADPVLVDASTLSSGGSGSTIDSYLWYDSDTESEQSNTKDLSTKDDGEYWVAIEDANGCHDTDSIVLVVHALPVVDLREDTSICAGDDALELAAFANPLGDTTYTWRTSVGGSVWITTGQTTPSIDVDTANNYKVVIKDKYGCLDSSAFKLTINILPVIELRDSAICGDAPEVVWKAAEATPGMDKYTWSDTEIAGNGELSTKIAGEYWIAIEDVNHCVDTDTIALIVNNFVLVDIGDDTVDICSGDPAFMLDAGIANCNWYKWTPDNFTGNDQKTYAVDAEDKYYIELEDENGCKGSDSMYLRVNTPEATIRDSSVCIDADDVLFDIGADFDEYLWSTGDITRTSKISAAGDHSVTFTTSKGCEGIVNFKLVRTALPIPDLGADQIICADASALNFTPGVFTSYLWNDGKTTPTLSTKVAGDYEVEVTDDKGCKASDAVKLTVIEIPTPDIIKEETKCPGSSHTFDVISYDNGNGPFTYAWHDGSTKSTFKTPIEATVWVDIKDKYGCIGRDEALVIDNKQLTVNILDNQLVNLCAGEDVTLIPNFKSADGYFFSWSIDGSGTSETSETFLANASGTYDLHVDNGGGCEGDRTIDVIVHPDPVLAALDPAGICDGEAAVIGGLNNLGGTYTYLWNTGETSATISVLTAGLYTQKVTSNQGCISEETIDVDVYSNPTPSIQGTTVCQGVPVTLTDLNDKGETKDFIWSTGALTPTISPIASGNFTLDVIDIHGCQGTSTTSVTFIAYPTVDLGDSITICEGDPKVTFDAGNLGKTITWNSGQTTSTISTNQAGEYIVTVSDGGCPAYDTVVLSVVDLPVSELNQLLGVLPYCFNELETGVLLEAGSRGKYEYLWGTGETTSAITVDVQGTYIVQISAVQKKECIKEDRIKLRDYCPSTLYVPNTFTPDNDGVNDYFLAVGDYITNFEMYVYNRWGQLIFQSDNINEGWDGTYFGNEVQIDTYVYKIYYDINQSDLPPASLQKVGIVNVLR